MLTETGTTKPREQANAERWAAELRDEFALSLGHDCPFAIEVTTDNRGEPALRVAGVLLTADQRRWQHVHIREYIASQLAAPCPSQSSLEWFDHDFELLGFVGYMHDRDYTSDPDGFQRWLDEFRRSPAKWTVEYIEFKAATAV